MRCPTYSASLTSGIASSPFKETVPSVPWGTERMGSLTCDPCAGVLPRPSHHLTIPRHDRYTSAPPDGGSPTRLELSAIVRRLRYASSESRPQVSTAFEYIGCGRRSPLLIFQQ